MCEAEILIKSIEKYPWLWDTNHADYHNRELKDCAWEQICNSNIKNWDTCTNKAVKCKYR